MKVGAVSGDLVVKLALTAGAVALLVYLVRKQTNAVAAAAAGALASVEEFADSVIVGVNPSNPSNWVNQGVSSFGGAVVSDTGPGRNADGSWTLGGWLFDVTHSDPWGLNAKPAKNPLADAYQYGGPSTGVYGVQSPGTYAMVTPNVIPAETISSWSDYAAP